MLKRRPITIIVLLIFGILLVLDHYKELPSWPFALLFFIFFIVTVGGSFFIRWNYHLTALHSNKGISKKQLSITFDDGPHPEFTPKILDLLKKHNAKATFFCIGKKIKAHPEIFKRILHEGHGVGNHTYSHSKSFGFYGTRKVMAELKDTVQLVKNLANKEMLLYRPAFGVTNPMIEKAVKLLGVTSIGWSIRSLDTTSRTEKAVLRRITSKVSKGDIILLHDTSQKTVTVLEQLLLFLEEQNFESIPVDQLLEIKAYA